MSSRRRSLTAAVRAYARWIAMSCLLAQLVVVLHPALVRHERCPCGELAHAEDDASLPRLTIHPPAALLPAAPATPEIHDEDHCDVAAAPSSAAPAVAGAPAPRVPAAWNVVPASTQAVPSPTLYLLAPKTSPPTAA